MYLDSDAKKKAVRLNPKYAFSVPWHEEFQVIAAVLGFSNISPTPEAFAEGVAAWQASKPGLKIDGILGPNTWKNMQPETFISPGQSIPAPSWIKDTPHKAQAKPAQGGRKNSGTWIGISAEVCWMAGAAGRGMALQKLYSVDDPQRNFLASADRVKIGVGLGYGVSASAVVMTNVYDPKVLLGRQFGSYDFNVSLGTKVTALVKNAVNAERMTTIAKTIKKINDMEKAKQKAEALKAGKKIVQLGGGEIEALTKLFKESGELYDNIKKDGPTVSLIALPLPGMVEVSAGYVDDKYDFIHY